MKQALLFILSFLMIHSYSQQWEELDSGTDYILFDISIPPGQSEVIYAAGMQYTWDAEGIIIKSIDGGDSWQQIVGGIGTPGFEAICFTSTEVGYVAGWDGYIAKTIDGGNSWTSLNAGFDNWFFMDLEFFNADKGLALANLNSGASGIYVTSNAGTSWTAATGINQNVQDLDYANENVIYAVGGDEKISKSLDGGLSFNEIYSGTPSRFFIGCDFNENFGAIGGEDGKIFSTTDGGNTWNNFATGYENFQGIHVFDNDSAYVGGTDENIYKTLDWGLNWDWEENGTGFSHIYKIKFASDGTGFLCGSQGMIKRKAAPAIALTALFEANETHPCSENEVEFTDMSTGNIESWEWTFEGGEPETSSEQNPSIYYAIPGIYDVSLTVTSGDNESTLLIEDYITVHNCMGAEEASQTQLSIFPNPAQDMLYIKGINGEARVRIVDLSGQIVWQGSAKSKLDISGIYNGSYILEIQLENQWLREKLIIRK